jgi:hypothetical protein
LPILAHYCGRFFRRLTSERGFAARAFTGTRLRYPPPMELFLLVGGVVLVWWFVSNGRERRKRLEQNDRRFDLANFEIDNSDEYVRDDWNFSFETMQALHRYATLDGPGIDSKQTYELRRFDGPRWEWRLDAKSYRNECIDIESEDESKTRNTLLGTKKEPLAEAHARHQWKPMPAPTSSIIEARYARFVRQG